MNMKKLFLLNLPYLLFVYPFDKLAQAFRLAPGADLSGKLLSIGDGFTAALSSPWLSFHPTDLLIGIAGAVILRMAVYLKGKNAKKYRHGIEYGSARWGTAADIAPYMDKDFFQNIPMTQTERITMASRPKQPKYARNKNILVIGGSGSGKTRFFCKPSLLQAHSSYVCTDPKGTLLPEIGAFLERKKYRIKCLNLINFRKSMKYNPLAYIRSEKDILKLVNALIMNTKGEGEKSSEDFWVKAERLYYSALIGYIWYEATEEEKNFITLLDLINASEAREDDETYQSPVDLLFSQLEEREPDHFAVKQYRKFKMAAGKTLKYAQFQAGMEMGDHCGSLQEIINLTENLDCYEVYPDIHDYDDLGRYYIEELDVMQVPEHLQNYIDYEAYGRDVALEENGTFTDQGYVRDTGDSFHEYYDGERGSIPDEYRVMTFQDDLPEEEKSEWAMDIAFDMDEFFRQNDPQYAAEHPEAHAAKEELYESLMAGRISTLDEKLAALGQTQEDYLPSEIEKFKDATGYEEFLDFDPAEVKAALDDPDKSHADEMLSAAEKVASEKMTVLVVEPMKEPYVKEIDPDLHSLQAEVGGDIGATYPYSDPVALVCNDEGKLIGLDLNRGLRDENGEIYDIVAGTFLVVGLGEEDFASLSPELIQKYTEQFKTPERFMQINGNIVVLPVPAEKQDLAYLPDRFETGERVQTPRGSFQVTAMSREQMEAAGYGVHHISDDGKYLIMGNGTRAFAVAAEQPEKDNPLRTAEMTLEDDYGMIDGVINNGRRGEELEKAQGYAERTTPEKPSIRERLEDAKRECAEYKPPEGKKPGRDVPEHDCL